MKSYLVTDLSRFTFLDPRISKVQILDDFSDDNIDEHYLDRARVVLGEATDFIGLKGLYKSLKNNKSGKDVEIWLAKQTWAAQVIIEKDFDQGEVHRYDD